MLEEVGRGLDQLVELWRECGWPTLSRPPAIEWMAGERGEREEERQDVEDSRSTQLRLAPSSFTIGGLSLQ